MTFGVDNCSQQNTVPLSRTSKPGYLPPANLIRRAKCQMTAATKVFSPAEFRPQRDQTAMYNDYEEMDSCPQYYYQPQVAPEEENNCITYYGNFPESYWGGTMHNRRPITAESFHAGRGYIPPPSPVAGMPTPGCTYEYGPDPMCQALESRAVSRSGRVPRTLSDNPFSGLPDTDAYPSRWFRPPSSRRPVHREGRAGSGWRHLAECRGNLGNNIVFVEGTVKQNDTHIFPPHGYPRISAAVPPFDPHRTYWENCRLRVPPPERPVPRVPTATAQARRGFKYWYNEKPIAKCKPTTIQGRAMTSGFHY